MMARRGHTQAGRSLIATASTSTLPALSLRPTSFVSGTRSHHLLASPAGTAPTVRDPSCSTHTPFRAHFSSVSSSSYKGKQRADSTWSSRSPQTLHGAPHRLPVLLLQAHLNRQQIRHFHATSRRDAIPLVPAAIGIFKSASVLTAVTAISRVLISFLPLSALAALRSVRVTKWVAQEEQKPDASPEAEEFWKMWCEGEEGKHPTWDQAKDLLEGKQLPDGNIVDSHGRTAHCMPVLPHRGPGGHHKKDWVIKITEQPRTNETGRDQTTWLLRTIQRTRFYLPDLPPASVRYYHELSEEQQNEVNRLRTYYLSLQMFKLQLRAARWFMSIVLFLPMVLLLVVYICGLERVPLTGRWRVLLLTPEEEDAISTSLAGANWYRSVINLLTTPDHPAPPIVPYEDWRWRWVQGVLRQLENAILAECHGLEPPYGPPLTPIPPPLYPLKPRPRVSSLLHSALPGGEPHSGKEHLEIGPPYSLMIMDKEEQNAFSYGFGGKGAGGIVVYTGLLDQILREVSPMVPEPVKPRPTGLAAIFSNIFSPAAPQTPTIPQPTEEQTLHLACVLAHEIGHLLLSHHLETLSQQQVLWPSILNLTMDIVRAFIWPVTFFLGPTLNDALANMGRTSTDELVERYGQIGFQYKHEYEADLAGLRVMTLAGFDPHRAVAHISRSVAELHELQPLDGNRDEGLTGRMFKLWTRATHPSADQRTAAVKEELKRWAEETKALESGE